ncbi:MAG: PKD domain-containing protein [Chitinophagales bacterium]
MNKTLIQKLLMAIAMVFTLTVNGANINVTGDITVNTSWTNNNNYIIYGDIIVKSGVTLTIQEGTIIRGDKTTLSRLVVAIGGKLIAQGTPEQPIVFTSNQPAGSRARADWAGLAICGQAPVNFKDGSGNSIQGRLECGTTTDYDYGGNVVDDSSGVISYVRIEYAGYVCGTNSELNSLTLGGVGNRTRIDHVMVSYGQDDGYEFFGGTVNANHIVSFGSRDDDFDTDNGYSGKVQYGLIVRVDTIADQGDISNAFESDNDANGTYNDPYTKGVFSNVTVVGPAATTSSNIDAKYGWAARLRRNSGLNIFNSLFIGYKRGLRIEGTSTQTKATFDTLEFKNNIIAGSKEQYYETAFDSLYLLAQSSNTIIRGNANDTVNLVSPYGNPDNFNFLPQSGSPALSGASFSNPKLNGLSSTTYRGAFGNENWATCWAEFSPQNEDYTAGPINYGYTASIAPSGSTTFCAGGSVDLAVNTNASGATYRWNDNSTSSTLTATTGGTYTVTVTSARGCTQVVTQTVTVNSNPANPQITASALSFCTGSNGVQLSSSASNSYSWSNSSTNDTITVTNPGSYNVTITDANGCSASGIAVQITENTPVVAVVSANGATSFCLGDSIEITVNNQNSFNTFVWSNNSNNDTITVYATGNYNVTTTDANNCSAVSNTITTNVSNAPTPTISAGGAITFCDGDSVTLTSSAGDSYLWSNFATTQSITVIDSGSYSVVVTNSNACNGVGVSNSITVDVNPQPAASFTQAAQGSSYTLAFTNTSADATTYNWIFGDNQSSTSPSPVHTYTQNGTYTVTLTASNGTCTDETTQIITITGVGFEEILSNIQDVRLYPNPNSGLATLEINTTMNVEATIIISDITGRQLMTTNRELTGGTNTMTIHTNEFAAGIYFVTVANGTEHNTIRMTVSK